jgi:hypothetical protein
VDVKDLAGRAREGKLKPEEFQVRGCLGQSLDWCELKELLQIEMGMEIWGWDTAGRFAC